MKIGIIGVGRVGSTAAYRILQDKDIILDTLILNDVIEDRIKGIRLDLCHAFPDENITIGSYGDLNDCDVVVITAGYPRTPDMKTRMDLLDKNLGIFKTIFQELKPNKNMVLIILTNPSDALTYIAYRLSGLERNRVVGFGGQLDTARLRFILSNELSVIPSKIETYVIGQHGEGMIPIFSETKIDGKILAEFPIDKNRVREKLRVTSKEILSLIGGTTYGPAQHISELVKSISNDEKRILCVSTLLNGEYSVSDVCMTVPCIVGKDGVEKIIELGMNKQEMTEFIALSEELKKILKKIRIR